MASPFISPIFFIKLLYVMISFAYLPDDLCGAIEGDKKTIPLISFFIS